MDDIKLSLTDWQKRMVQDYLGVKATVVAIPRSGGPIALYMAIGVPPVSGKNAIMYLTDEQMTIVKNSLGTSTPCSHMEIGTGLPIKFS